MTKRKIAYWVIPPEADGEFVAHLEEVLETYEKSYDSQSPVLCMDEQPVQLIGETRVPIKATKHHPERVDYEYERKGTASIFMFAEPLSGFRQATARPRRTKVDWALEVAHLLDTRYAKCRKVTLVSDNLNTHTKGAFYETFPPGKAREYVRRIEFVNTPKHGSWLNIAECELSCLLLPRGGTPYLGIQAGPSMSSRQKFISRLGDGHSYSGQEYVYRMASTYQDGIAQGWTDGAYEQALEDNRKGNPQQLRTGYWSKFVFWDPSVPKVSPERLPPARLFQPLGFAVMRSDWTNDATRPDHFVVFDRVVTAQPDLTRTWLLHCLDKPACDGKEIPDKSVHPEGHFLWETDGEVITDKEMGGRLFVKFLLPKKEERIVRLLGGPGHDFEVDGTNYGPKSADAETYKMQVQHAVMTTMGFVVRDLGVQCNTEEFPDGYHHGVNEVWSNDYAKWVLMDGGYDFHFERDGVPLSALEAHEAVRADGERGIVKVQGPDRAVVPMKGQGFPFTSAIGYWWVSYHVRQNTFTQPKGNDSRLVIFDNEAFRQTTWYRMSSDNVLRKHWAYGAKAFVPAGKRHQINWTPGVPDLRVRQTAPAELEVRIESVTPNFKTTRVRTNGGDWQTVTDERFGWKLREGDNRLEVRTRNLLDVDGPLVTAAVTLKRTGN